MKKIFICLLFIIPVASFGQLRINVGVKAGVNFANVTSTPGLNSNSLTGYMIGGYIAPKPKKVFGFRSEILLSRQGYDYKTNTNTGNVNLDYLLLPQLLTINFSKKVQVHLGPQIGLLLNAKVDSTKAASNSSLLDYFNRFDYAAVGGAELYPFRGFFIGGRVNISLNKANQTPPPGGNWPGFIPHFNAKNNVVQFYVGWRF